MTRIYSKFASYRIEVGAQYDVISSLSIGVCALAASALRHFMLVFNSAHTTHLHTFKDFLSRAMNKMGRVSSLRGLSKTVLRLSIGNVRLATAEAQPPDGPRKRADNSDSLRVHHQTCSGSLLVRNKLG